ncbi:MAG: hypothetical protein A2Y15_04005 [Clostridiales bacterium GWF2_36_10]|nr:MAG: hypothetical protein A2Y15_04005 [Clostridiales bacterium GWF2_36_10]HAN20331.1 hypothetical protein [Clostridiales bacterium]
MIKNVYIIFSKLKSIACENVFMFSIFFIGIFTCNIMFTYFYGNIMAAYEKDSSAVYDIYNTNNVMSDINKISELPYTDRIFYNSLVDKESLKDNNADIYNIDEFLSSYKNSKIYFLTTKNDMNDIVIKSGKSSSLEEENTVILPRGLLKTGKDFSNIKINGITFKVVGITASTEFIVSNDTFIKNNMIPTYISVFNIPGLSEKQKNEFVNKTQEILDDTFTISENPSPAGSSEIISILIISVIVYLLSVVSLLYIMKYLFEQSAYELSIYEITGATKGNVIFILSSVQFVILLIIGIIAQIFHYVFYDAIFTEINIYLFSYSFADYFWSSLITVSSLMLLIILYINIKMKNTAIINSRKFVS